MPDISIKIRDKIAQVQGSPQIVCGNSDYAVTFDFDSEWDAYDRKTMHIVWFDVRTGELRHDNIQFSESTAVLPALYNTDRVCIGVYTGDIRTTTPACVPCARCITDADGEDPYHDDPPPDVYEQLMAYMEEIIEGGGGGTSHEVYPETLCFETSFPQNAPEVDVIQNYTWTPCGSACNVSAKHGDTVSDRRFSVSSDVPFLAVMVFGSVYSKTYEEIRPYPEGYDWTKVYETPKIKLTYEDTLEDNPDTKNHFGIKVYSKQFDAGSHTITYQHGASTSCMLFRFYNARSVSYSGDNLIQDTYTPPAPRGNQRVYLICQNAITGTSWRVDDYEPSSGQEMSTILDNNGNGYLYEWYDFQPEEMQQPTFVYEGDGEHIPDAESATCLTLDIVW